MHESSMIRLPRTLATSRNLRVGLISSYVPRKCGIATFSRDLIEAMQEQDSKLTTALIAAEAPTKSYAYPIPALATLKSDDIYTYIEAAERINRSDLNVLLLQHEFGLFGGQHANFQIGEVHHTPPLGDYIFELLKRIEIPVITTLHTVLTNPDPERREIMRRLAKHSEKLVAMTHDSKRLLINTCGIAADKIVVIPHGVPDLNDLTPLQAKRELGINPQSSVMSITGLIGPNKGVEIAIKALPQILEQNPNVQLYVVGQTHPEIIKHSGEVYREELIDLATKLGVITRVKFVNHYLPTDQLVKYLAATDLYLTLHKDPEQAASGTLAYAVGAGRVAISTPYRYAKELLSAGRGFLVPFNDPSALSTTVNQVLSDWPLFNRTQTKAKTYGKFMSWPNVAKAYLDSVNTHVLA